MKKVANRASFFLLLNSLRKAFEFILRSLGPFRLRGRGYFFFGRVGWVIVLAIQAVILPQRTAKT